MGAQLVAVFLLPPGHLAHDQFELLLKLADQLLGLLLLRLRQLVELLWFQHLAFPGGRQRHPHGGAHEGDVMFRRLSLDLVEFLLLFLLELFVQRLALRPVILAVDGGGNGFAQFGDQLFHRTPERHRAARRQLQRQRPVGLGDIVDIDPVGRQRRTKVCLPVPGGPRANIL